MVNRILTLLLTLPVTSRQRQWKPKPHRLLSPVSSTAFGICASVNASRDFAHKRWSYPQTYSRQPIYLNKKWGTAKTLAQQNLYPLRSFDAAAQTFNYDVNRNAGLVTPSGNPYQIRLGLRYSF